MGFETEGLLKRGAKSLQGEYLEVGLMSLMIN